MKAASASKKKGVLKKTRNSRTIWNYHIMVLIGMVWLFFFNIVPMFGIVIAFEDYNPMSGLWHSDFVGMENFAYLFSMSDCKRVIINTLVIAVAKLILNIIVPLAFALLLNEIRQVKFKKAVQTIVYLPVRMSGKSSDSMPLFIWQPLPVSARSFTKRQRLTAAAAGKQYGISPFRVLQAPSLY